MFLLLLVVIVLFAGCAPKKDDVVFGSGEGDEGSGVAMNRKLMLVQSYWTNYKWGIDIEKGVLEALSVSPEILYQEPENREGLGIKEGLTSKVGNIEVELMIVCMDTKRRSDDAWKKESGEKTLSLIDKFNPDVVILADDNAQQYVGKAIVNKVPIVFCGVNQEYTAYYSKEDQVTGLHERMNFIASSDLLKEVFPDVSRLVLLTDFTETSASVISQFKAETLPFDRIESFAFEAAQEYKNKLKSLQGEKETAIAIFNLNFRDMNQEEAIAWTVTNSKLPEMTFQTNTVEGGLLLTSAVSGVSHGREAVEKSLSIFKGSPANDIPVTVPRKGDIAVNQARARMLGIELPVTLLNAAEVFNELESLQM